MPLIDLPLTGQLWYPASPVSRFLAEYLPSIGRVVRDYQQRIGELAADVGELAVPADVDAGEPGAPLARVEPLAERGLGRLGGLAITPSCLTAAASS